MSFNIAALKCADCPYWQGAANYSNQMGICARYPVSTTKPPEGEACGEHPDAARYRAHAAAESFIYASFAGGYPMVTVDRANHNR